MRYNTFAKTKKQEITEKAQTETVTPEVQRMLAALHGDMTRGWG